MNKKIGYLSIIVAVLSFPGQSILINSLIVLSMLSMLYEALKIRNGNVLLFRSNNRYSIIFMLLWLLYAIITIFWVKDFSGWNSTVYYLFCATYFTLLFMNIFKSINDIVMVFNIISIVLIVHNLIGWFQVITGKYIFAVNNETNFRIERAPVSSFYNTNDFATFLLFSIFITLASYKLSKNRFIKVIYILSIISSILLLLLTQSRSNLIGLFIGLIFYLWFSIDNKKMKILILATLIFWGLALLLNPNLINNILNNFVNVFNFNFESETSSGGIRTKLIRNGLHFLSKTHLIGVGAGNVEYWMNNHSVYYTSGTLNMHNWWMEILTSFGVVIFIFYIIFYTRLFTSLKKIYNNAFFNEYKVISLSLQSIMAAYVIGSLASSSNMKRHWIWLFWALCIAFQGLVNQKDNKKIKNLP